MGLIDKFAQIIENSRREYENIKAGDFEVIEKLGTCSEEPASQAALGDNALFMKYLLDRQGMEGKIQTVYIDPPFFTKSKYDAVLRVEGGEEKGLSSIKYSAYDDVWEKNMESYLEMLCLRLMLIKDLLADTGTLWVHLDWHADHYVKVLLDEIFGAERFVNEIVWTYKSGGSSKHHFSRKHDTILVYSKTRKYYFSPLKEKSYNRGFKPYRFKGVEEFQDEIGWYTMVYMKDVWNIDMVGRTSGERNGYATQKPEALIQRILQCSTQPGDICADFFAGSGTFAAVAEKMGRKWICCDNEPLAAGCTVNRVASDCLKSGKEFSMEFIKQQDSCELQPDAKGNLRASLIPFEDDGVLKYKVKVDSYLPSVNLDRIDEKSREAVSRIDGRAGLGTISRISIGTDDETGVHRPEILHIVQKNENIEELEFVVGCKSVNLVVWDIFGNRLEEKITI